MVRSVQWRSRRAQWIDRPGAGAATRALCAALALAAGLACADARERPHILLVYVDDEAPGSLGFEGNALIRTPNLDRLARAGTRFARSYVPLPQCAPSRAAVLTGRYPHAAGVMSNSDARLDPSLPTIATLLGEAGYRRGFVGKWHLGEPERPQAGFDDGWIALDLSASGHARYFDAPLWIGGERRTSQGYLGSVLTDHAIEFIDADDGRPFFLWLAYKTPHYPFVRPERGPPRIMPSAIHPPASASDDLRGKPAAQRESEAHRWFTEGGDYTLRSDRARYYAMLEALDADIGRLLAHLAERGLLERTLLVFTSDNGVLLGEHQMVGKAPAFYEELVRVPLLLHWPGVVPADQERTELVSALDLLPTFAGLAGARLPAGLDGADLWPLVLGRGGPLRDAVFFEYTEKSLTGQFVPMLGVATGRHKYVRYLADGEEELYDLAADPRELNNLARSGVHSEVLGPLRERVDEFQRGIREPFWLPADDGS
jgi:N-acetylglucosamine-6-sulfatase